MFNSLPGWLIALLTCPGIVIHEIAHRFFCDILGVKVYAICYFAFGSEDTVGCVLHEASTTMRQAFWISLGPLIINTLICALFTFPLMASQFLVGDFMSRSTFPLLGYLFLAWIGFSAGAHAFPSDRDLSNVLETAKELNVTPSLFTLVLIRLIIGLNFLESLYISFLYAYGVSLLLPYILLG